MLQPQHHRNITGNTTGGTWHVAQTGGGAGEAREEAARTGGLHFVETREKSLGLRRGRGRVRRTSKKKTKKKKKQQPQQKKSKREEEEEEKQARRRRKASERSAAAHGSGCGPRLRPIGAGPRLRPTSTDRIAALRTAAYTPNRIPDTPHTLRALLHCC